MVQTDEIRLQCHPYDMKWYAVAVLVTWATTDPLVQRQYRVPADAAGAAPSGRRTRTARTAARNRLCI